MSKLSLVTTCVTVPPEDLPLLELAVEKERPVTFQTFAKHVDVKSVSESLGYQQGRARKGERLLKLGNDWAVSFYRSVWKVSAATSCAGQPSSMYINKSPHL